MTTYITLLNLTQQCIEKIKESLARLDRAKAAVKAAGGGAGGDSQGACSATG